MRIKRRCGCLPARYRNPRGSSHASLPCTFLPPSILQKERKKTRERFSTFTLQGLHDLLVLLHLPVGGKKVCSSKVCVLRYMELFHLHVSGKNMFVGGGVRYSWKCSTCLWAGRRCVAEDNSHLWKCSTRFSLVEGV